MSILVKRRAQLAATLWGIMIFLFVVLISIPKVVPNPGDRFAWTVGLRDLAFSGGAFAFAGTQMKDRPIDGVPRIGPFFDGSVKVVEGRGYDPDGKVTFNAFGTISFNPATKVYTLHSHAMGYVGDFVLTLTPDGYTWDTPAGSMTIRYTAVIKDGTWHEVGDRIMPGKDPVRFFEMNLKRVGDTNWFVAGAISPM